jgi:hypothetical protein
VGASQFIFLAGVLANNTTALEDLVGALQFIPALGWGVHSYSSAGVGALRFRASVTEPFKQGNVRSSYFVIS